MKKSFLLVIILTSVVLADTTDISYHNSRIKVNKTDSIGTITKVEITNLPPKDFWDKYGPIIAGLGGILLGWFLTFILQKSLIKRQLNLKQIEDWKNGFRNAVAELMSAYGNYYKRITPRLGHTEDLYKKKPDEIELLQYKEQINYQKNLLTFYIVGEKFKYKDQIINAIDDLDKILEEEHDLNELPRIIKSCIAMCSATFKLKERETLKNKKSSKKADTNNGKNVDSPS